MKKLAIGCGVIVLLLAVTASVAFYVLAYKARSYLRESGVVQSIETLSKGVANTAPFTPPANGELTADLVKRFAAVEDAMVAKLGPRVRELEAMEDEMMRRQAAEHRKSTPGEDFKNITSDMGFILQAQSAWVEALNQQRFSMDEYQWVRGRVWAASGMNISELSSRDLAAAIGAGGGSTRPIAQSTDPVPAHNRELVAPYQSRLKDWAPLAFFGL
jgi:hypothetical protein